MTINLDEAERVGNVSKPWSVNEWSKHKTFVELPQIDGEADVVAECCCKDDAAFIVFARNHWDEMCEELKTLRTSNERLQHACDIWEKNSADATQDWEKLQIAMRRLKEIADDATYQPCLHAAAGLREIADVQTYPTRKEPS